jgi:hypothetical protein
MNASFSRTSENVLFSLMIVAVLAWTAVSVASDPQPPQSSIVCAIDSAAHHVPAPALRSLAGK